MGGNTAQPYPTLGDTAQDGTWFCEACGQASEPEWRYILHVSLADHSGTEDVTMFQARAPCSADYDLGGHLPYRTHYGPGALLPPALRRRRARKEGRAGLSALM